MVQHHHLFSVLYVPNDDGLQRCVHGRNQRDSHGISNGQSHGRYSNYLLLYHLWWGTTFAFTFLRQSQRQILSFHNHIVVCDYHRIFGFYNHDDANQRYYGTQRCTSRRALGWLYGCAWKISSKQTIISCKCDYELWFCVW